MGGLGEETCARLQERGGANHREREKSGDSLGHKLG